MTLTPGAWGALCGAAVGLGLLGLLHTDFAMLLLPLGVFLFLLAVGIRVFFSPFFPRPQHVPSINPLVPAIDGPAYIYYFAEAVFVAMFALAGWIVARIWESCRPPRRPIAVYHGRRPTGRP